MVNTTTLEMLSRLKRSQEGIDFIEFLKQLALSNYSDWKKEGGDVLRGKAIAYDGLIMSFEACDSKLATQLDTKDTWM